MRHHGLVRPGHGGSVSSVLVPIVMVVTAARRELALLVCVGMMTFTMGVRCRRHLAVW